MLSLRTPGEYLVAAYTKDREPAITEIERTITFFLSLNGVRMVTRPIPADR
jgi:hypothetical protein